MKKIFINGLVLAVLVTGFAPIAQALTYDEIVAGQKGGKVLGDTSGVQFTLNKNVLQSLTYNGQSFLTASLGPIVTSAYFKTPAGVEKPYSNLLFNTASTTVGANGEFFQHVYRPGKEDSLTLKMGFAAIDSKTLKVTVDVTNNDPVNTLTQFSLRNFLQLTLPAPLSQYQGNNTIILVASAGNFKPAQFWSGTWGSVAMWPDRFDNNSSLVMSYNSAAQVLFNPILGNNYKVSINSNVLEDRVLPGQTWHYSFNVRFGNASDTLVTLAPESFSAVRTSFPYLLNWPDRRPIARAFIAEGTRRSALNPRGYLSDSLLDVSNTTLFRQKMLERADRTLANMNAMDPKPQGLMIWDLEGQEFDHAFTYIGYPSKIADLAPEMDKIADEYLKKFTDAGYKVGMTLRPSDFDSGSVLPSSCHYDTNYELSDKFIKTDAAFPNRSFLCIAENTWKQNTTGKGLGLQETLTDDTQILNNLRSKVTYARNRWGAKIFYVDSTVYPGGAPINFEIWRTLQREFPDTLFFPENEATMYFGSSAPYNQANMGVFETFSGPKNIYPEAFSVIMATDGINYADPDTYNRALAAIKAGNIYMVDGWYSSPQNAQILKVYRDAAAGGSATPPPTPISSDLNKDGAVNTLDFSLINRKWNVTSGISTLDINQDGKIDSLDFDILKTKWHKKGD